MIKRKCSLCDLELDDLEAEDLIQTVKMLKAEVDYLQLQIDENKKKIAQWLKKERRKEALRNRPAKSGNTLG